MSGASDESLCGPNLSRGQIGQKRLDTFKFNNGSKNVFERCPASSHIFKVSATKQSRHLMCAQISKRQMWCRWRLSKSTQANFLRKESNARLKIVADSVLEF